MKNLIGKVNSVWERIDWTIFIILITAGICVAIITGIIGLYIFAAYAHAKSALDTARAFLWRT